MNASYHLTTLTSLPRTQKNPLPFFINFIAHLLRPYSKIEMKCRFEYRFKSSINEIKKVMTRIILQKLT